MEHRGERGGDNAGTVQTHKIVVVSQPQLLAEQRGALPEGSCAAACPQQQQLSAQAYFQENEDADSKENG